MKMKKYNKEGSSPMKVKTQTAPIPNIQELDEETLIIEEESKGK